MYISVSKNTDFGLEHKTQISVSKNTDFGLEHKTQISVSKNTGTCIGAGSFEIYFEETRIRFLRTQVRV
ncbi:hypothetical protein RIR_jg22761.t1 [Rhizophagus irregularis DAOM 181602=DAOM 197198]|nr:hypothetical protein RIR_jg22761.t1 [Rhizophagus irregularis DAOM 181602=DAOM 197198]